MDLKIFVNTDDDIRLSRRLLRDIRDRGRTIESVLLQYNAHVKKAYDDFIKPTMKYADIIIPRGKSNEVAIFLLIDHIKVILKKMIPKPFAPPFPFAYNAIEKKEIEKLHIKNIEMPTEESNTMAEVANKLIMDEWPALNE